MTKGKRVAVAKTPRAKDAREARRSGLGTAKKRPSAKPSPKPSAKPSPKNDGSSPPRRSSSIEERGEAADERSIPILNGPNAADDVDEKRSGAERARARRSPQFPVVGIGASAGGLEALEQFLRMVPPSSGMAFVLVQHLDPTHKGAIVELLSRVASIPVLQVKDRQKVEPNHLYVIPPNCDMSILHGVLHLLTPAGPRGHHLPIDFFFRSLADDRKELAIGVVLSGMGSDGTLGLRAIKERAGATFVQNPASAKFDGMPHSAIDGGLADVIATADELPARIAAYIRHAPVMAPRLAQAEDRTQSALEKVFVLLRAHTGNDFSLYKRSTIVRRVERRMGLLQIDKIGKYVQILRDNPRETELLFKELLIGVTSFFRDPDAWDHLARALVPAILSARSDAVLRAWVPGCSTGEEAYSLAMMFREAIGRLRPIKNVTLQIFATDLDRDAIERARFGVYPASIVSDVSADRLRRFFVQEERGFRVSKTVREMVVFAPQNLILDPPLTKLHILSCRNLLIYLAPELQKRLMPLFHYSLNPGGLLFLGSAETVGGHNSLFDAIDGKMRIYRRREVGMGAVPLEFHGVSSSPGPITPAAADPLPMQKATVNVQSLADRVLVQRYSPVGILCNDKGDILYISGRGGKYLEPVAGKADWNVMAMAREGLRYPLNTAFLSAQRSDRPITARAVKVAIDGGTEIVDITVERVTEPEALRGTLMIVIAEVSARQGVAARQSARSAVRGLRIQELEKELRHTREETQIVREEMQTSQEELRSTNEELQSTNEALQSTNEELTTSKEEMQSMNEELQTVLDGALHVRRFTTQTAKIIS